MIVNEVFPAVQGEGPLAGLACVFVRLHGCPVACAWCDTSYTWDGTENGRRLSVEQVVSSIVAAQSGCHHVVVSGGEPLVQAGLPELLEVLDARFASVEVETSGIRRPPAEPVLGLWSRVRWNVSPKMPSAQALMRPDPLIIRSWASIPSATLKVVISDVADLDAMRNLVAVTGWSPERVMLMPQGRTPEEVSRGLAWLMGLAAAQAWAFRISTRLHVHAFGDRRAV